MKSLRHIVECGSAAAPWWCRACRRIASLLPRRVDRDGNRHFIWPVRLGWARKTTGRFFDRHGWQVGCERVPLVETGYGCMPGFRKVFGQTFHIGALKVIAGPRPRDFARWHHEGSWFDV